MSFIGNAPAAKLLTADDIEDGVISSQELAPEAVQSSNLADNAFATVTGLFKNLVVKSNTTTPNSQVDISADELILKDSDGRAYTAINVSLTANIATSGVNGLDTGAESANAWYYLWVIYNGTTVSSLISLSSTNPTMPSGYTYKAMVGAVRNSSSNFLSFYQLGKHVTLAITPLDLTDTTPATARTAFPLTVPPNVVARIRCYLQLAGNAAIRIFEESQTDANPALDFDIIVSTGAERATIHKEVRVDSSSQAYYRSSTGSVGSFDVYTLGWSFQ